LSFADAGNCHGLGGWPLWMSDPSSPAGRPRIPSPWSTYAIHQFGTTGSIDRDTANYESLGAMQAHLGRAAAGSPGKDRDMPSGTLLPSGPTPIRTIQRKLIPFSQLLLSTIPAVSAAEAIPLTVTILDRDGTYNRDVSVSWDKPGVVKFRHPRLTKAVSVRRADTGGPAVAWLLS
jgi:hypothetical protein